MWNLCYLLECGYCLKDGIANVYTQMHMRALQKNKFQEGGTKCIKLVYNNSFAQNTSVTFRKGKVLSI